MIAKEKDSEKSEADIYEKLKLVFMISKPEKWTLQSQ